MGARFTAADASSGRSGAHCRHPPTEIRMKYRTPLSLLAAACLVSALAACDRRDSHPPDESRTTHTDIEPAGTAGDASLPADSGTPDDRCPGMADQQLRDCMQAEENAREGRDIRQ